MGQPEVVRQPARGVQDTVALLDEAGLGHADRGDLVGVAQGAHGNAPVEHLLEQLRFAHGEAAVVVVAAGYRLLLGSTEQLVGRADRPALGVNQARA